MESDPATERRDSVGVAIGRNGAGGSEWRIRLWMTEVWFLSWFRVLGAGECYRGYSGEDGNVCVTFGVFGPLVFGLYGFVWSRGDGWAG